jgi:hypothetical protein
MITWGRAGEMMTVNEPPRWQRPSLEYALQTQAGQRVLLIINVVGCLVILTIGIWFTAVHHPGGVFLLVVAGVCTALAPLAILKYRRRWKTGQRI